MQLIKNLLFILILIISVVFIIDLMEKNNDNFIKETYLKTSIAKKDSPNEYNKEFLKTNKPIDQVRVRLPFTEAKDPGLKIWIFFLAVLTVGVFLGFIMGLIHIISQKRENLSYKSKLKKLQLELDTLRNQSIEDDLILNDDLSDDNKPDVMLK
tara:strand:- start:102 stop:563 length:462 start_codon:yes stop_codon:yes gene_type:complete